MLIVYADYRAAVHSVGLIQYNSVSPHCFVKFWPEGWDEQTNKSFFSIELINTIKAIEGSNKSERDRAEVGGSASCEQFNVDGPL